MNTTSGQRPRPHISQDTEFFWDAALEHRLVVQQCDSCGALQHPPAPACHTCHSLKWHPHEVSGRGTVESYTVHHHPPVPGFDHPVVALIALIEGVKMISNIVGDDAADVRIGDAVNVEFLVIDPDYVVPQFKRST